MSGPSASSHPLQISFFRAVARCFRRWKGDLPAWFDLKTSRGLFFLLLMPFDTICAERTKRLSFFHQALMGPPPSAEPCPSPTTALRTRWALLLPCLPHHEETQTPFFLTPCHGVIDALFPPPFSCVSVCSVVRGQLLPPVSPHYALRGVDLIGCLARRWMGTLWQTYRSGVCTRSRRLAG